MVKVSKIFSGLFLRKPGVGVAFGRETKCAILFHFLGEIQPTHFGQAHYVFVFLLSIHACAWCGNETAFALILIRRPARNRKSPYATQPDHLKKRGFNMAKKKKIEIRHLQCRLKKGH
jgi:hypothetical protein